MEMGFGTQNIRSLYKVGSLMKAVKEVSKYKVHLLGQKIRWDRDGTRPAGKYTFFYGKGFKNNELGTGFISK